VDPAAAALLQAQLDAINGVAPLAFAKGSFSLTPEGLTTISQIAGAIQTTPAVVQIQAFTDSKGIAARNLALSTKRAVAIKAALVEAGVRAELLVPIGRGANSPVASNATAAGQAANRRIAFVVVGGPNDPRAR
jgi:OmpA-OmpF porin, OOP family